MNAEYFRLEQQKLLADFQMISLFTGHPTTLGNYREQVLRDYLRKLTPNYLTIKSGFVANNGLNPRLNQTKQVDCLVYDSNNFVAYLETSDFAIIRPEALFGAFEVKSQLTLYKENKKGEQNHITDENYPLYFAGQAYRWGGTLIDALSNIMSVAKTTPIESHAYISGIFAYTASFSYETYTTHIETICDQLGISHLRELPDIICVPGSYAMMHLPNNLSMDPIPNPDPFESWVNYLGVADGDEQLPLQFFSYYYSNNLQYRTNKLLSVIELGVPTVKFCSVDFPLNNEGL